MASQLSLRDRWRDLVPELTLKLSLGAEASVAAGGGKRPAIGTLVDSFASLSRRAPDRPAASPSCLLILIDEAQKLADRDVTTVELLLDALRNREGLRTLTILAGLPDTGTPFDLGHGALRREESVELRELWLADNGFQAETPAPLDRIARHAQDWPEHLVHHVRAMVEAAARNLGLVDASAVTAANAAALPATERSYDQRLRVLLDRPARDHDALLALATAAERLGGSLSAATAARIVEAFGARDDLRSALRHAGVLVEAGGRSSFAVPLAAPVHPDDRRCAARPFRLGTERDRASAPPAGSESGG